jgi:O-antigen ligase
MSLEMISDHWLLGIGMGNYRSVMDQYRERYGAVSHAHAHNTLLQITTETGLLGLAAYLAIWFVFFKEVFVTFRSSTDPMTRGLAAGSFGALVGFHVAGLFEYNFGDSEVAMMMWFMVGLGMAAGLCRSEAAA